MLSSPLLQDDELKQQHANADYEAFLDPIESPELHRAQTPGTAVPSALEEMDNLLRIYRNLPDDEQRAKVYLEFWSKYNNIARHHSHLILHIPPRVRGYLAAMAEVDMEPYKRDRIMGHVLSRNGLLEEPKWTDSRYLFR